MYVRVRATPSAKKESVIEVDEKTLSIAVREEAKHNLANTRIRELVAHHFSVPLAYVRIIGGHTSRQKLLSIERSG
jgi:uncharacterized protein YggU (UPF0235/DUF167 family)